MGRTQIILFGTLILIVIIGGVIYSFLGELDERSTTGVEQTELVDEAFKRVPIPPSPEVLEEASVVERIDSGPEDVITTDSLDNELSETTIIDTSEITETDTEFRRVLPGTTQVTREISDPRAECTGTSRETFDCYSDFITTKTTTEGIDEAFIDLKRRYNEGDKYVISQCHQFTHVIGRAATQLFPIVGEAYNHGDTFCWSGYHHGIMEAVIAEMDIKNIPTRLNNICADIPGKESYSFNYFNCVHGLGHGLMYVESHELFDALELCNNLNGSWEQSSCYGGVFMENVIANEVDHVSDYLKPDDLIYPCNAVGETYKQQCYLMQTSYALKELNYNFAVVFDLCENNADENYKDTCFQSLGRDASGNSSSDIDLTRTRCLLGKDANAQENCLIGAVKDFISYFHNDEQAKALCTTMPENLQDTCYATAESYYRNFPKS